MLYTCDSSLCVVYTTYTMPYTLYLNAELDMHINLQPNKCQHALQQTDITVCSTTNRSLNLPNDMYDVIQPTIGLKDYPCYHCCCPMPKSVCFRRPWLTCLPLDLCPMTHMAKNTPKLTRLSQGFPAGLLESGLTEAIMINQNQLR